MAVLNLQVKTSEGEIFLEVMETITGESLFNMICKTIGIEDTKYFGILIERNEYYTWLRMKQKISKQLKGSNIKNPLLFAVKFYPDFSEVKSTLTKYLFYLHMKQAIISECIICPADVCVLLASYALKIQKYNFDKGLKVDEFIPKSVLNKFNIDSNMWENIITHWCHRLGSISYETAISEYLKICEHLEMYGVTYFAVKNKNSTHLWLGVSASGVQIYKQHNFLKPSVCYKWSEIIRINARSNMLNLKLSNNVVVKVIVDKTIMKELFHLLVGNYKMHIKKSNFSINNNLEYNKSISATDVYRSMLGQMQQSLKQLEIVNGLMLEKCQLAEEEAIKMSGMLVAECLKNSRLVFRDFQRQFL